MNARPALFLPRPTPTAAGRRNPCIAVVTLRPHTHFFHAHPPNSHGPPSLARFFGFHNPRLTPALLSSPVCLCCLVHCACCNLPGTRRLARCSVRVPLPAFLSSGSVWADCTFLFFCSSLSFLSLFSPPSAFPFPPGPSEPPSGCYLFFNIF